MINHKRLSVPRLLTPVALAITLAACSSAPKMPTSVDITLEPSQSVEAYIINADSSEGSLQTDWLIMATKAALQANQLEQADLLIQRLARLPMSEKQQAEWQLARATYHQKKNQPRLITELLNFKAWWTLADSQWQEYYTLRAQAFQALDRPFEANRQWVALSKYVPEEQKSAIAEQIWANFSRYSQYEITQLHTESDEEVLDGWLQLAIYMKNMAGNVPQLKNTLEHWLAENPNHPAATYTPVEIQSILALEIIKPVNTALLLPLSGKFAKQAQLVRDGFIFAMMNDSGRDPNATLTVIDTNLYQAKQIKQRLIDEQIDFVVGPLRKEMIEALQQELQDENGKTQIPSLALNIPDTIQPGTGICYVALSPEQEVAQAAKHLFAEGYKYPLILAPQGAFGQRVVAAFEQEWQKYSTDKPALSYFGDKRQLQRDINSVFGLQESQQRIAQMESLMNVPMETQPRSRRDIDAVYIAARSSELTLIKPFIEVAINPDTKPPKLFSNSMSNSGEKQYEDLSGIAYSDIPLLIQANPALDNQMNQLWPEQSNFQKRLQALGMDSYKLMAELPQMKVVPSHSVNGKTGLLTIDNNCVVQREISWSEHGAL
ncbi:penicillin-binding protein activator [Vibrio navarrensis]|uniref:penicillin-binding protein activator n=1 Tax=Vibrio navarrensis TaxID=29495 RepID=UPI00186A0AD4|nr:penicillin-binding protein activator [Vibrio navarrensis]MBE4592639.1 penicillin-binding protein activator [Vibrio navarrensis]